MAVLHLPLSDRLWSLWSAWLLVALACATVVCVDSFLAMLIPRDWWPGFFQPFPYKLTAMVAIAGVALQVLARIVRRYEARTLGIVLLFAASQLGGFKLGIVDPLDVVTGLAFMAWLAACFAQPTLRVRLPILFFFAAALLIAGLAQGVHQNPVRLAVGILALSKVLLLAFILVQLLQDERAVRQAVSVFMVVAAVSAAIGVLQILLFLFAGIQFTLIEQFGAQSTEIKDTLLGPLMRASGLNATAQHLSVFLSLCLPFYLFRLTETGRVRHRLVLFAGTGLVIAGIVLTWNNVSLITLPVTLAIFLLWRWPHRLLHYAAFAGLVLGVLYFTGLLDLLMSYATGERGVISKGMFQRMTLLGWSLEKLGRDPWVGEGLREFSRYSGNYWGRPVHNAYLQVAVELGIPGMLVFLAMLLTMFTGLALCLSCGERLSRRYIKPCLLAFISMTVIMLGEPLMDNSNTWLFLALTQGMLLAFSAPGPAAAPMRARGPGADADRSTL